MGIWMLTALYFSNYIPAGHVFSPSNIIMFISPAGSIILSIYFCHSVPLYEFEAPSVSKKSN